MLANPIICMLCEHLGNLGLAKWQLLCDSCFTQLEEEARIYLQTKGLGDTTCSITEEQEMEQCFKCKKSCMMDQFFCEQCNLELCNETEQVETGKNNDEIIVISDDDE